MLLAIDIGNSNTKFGIFENDHLISKFTIPTRLSSIYNDLAADVGHNIDETISGAIVCSVVPEADAPMREFLAGMGSKKPVFVSNDLDFGLTINYEPLQSIGTDRLVNAYSGTEKHGLPCIVCSFGTATTIDVINAGRVFMGGIIAPGMVTMSRALHLNTSKLPEVEIEKPDTLLSNTTSGAIQSGIFYGYVAMVEGIIKRIEDEIGDDPKVIATGGFAKLISANTSRIDIVDENLLLDGLRILNDRMQNV